ncbi:hypothetical protein [Sphingomonas sp. M1-B02]|uniref:hypothetical protein n=1 Tax=Sphingomonas sp. M1-B02 TaxID=3114300 RepID=UPI00223EFE10|nr:hypothetical protein [Sphingomonas sp. S6-11]UZK66130.1 hypothetical protein OKW87_16730 [Sphingomonas sp. S6-11]
MTGSQWKGRAVLTTAAIVIVLVAVVGFALVNSKFGYITWDRGKLGPPRLLKQSAVGTDQIPELLAAMSRGSASIRYAALMLGTPDRPSDDDSVALQMSFENGKAGFDWVLLSPRNIEDEAKFKEFAREQGLEPVAHRQNDVSYLRVECANVAQFTARVVTEMYHRPADEPLGLVYEGFSWPQI